MGGEIGSNWFAYIWIWYSLISQTISDRCEFHQFALPSLSFNSNLRISTPPNENNRTSVLPKTMIVSSQMNNSTQSWSWKLSPNALICNDLVFELGWSSDSIILYTAMVLLFVMTMCRSFTQRPLMVDISLWNNADRPEACSTKTCVAVRCVAHISRLWVDNNGCSWHNEITNK